MISVCRDDLASRAVTLVTAVVAVRRRLRAARGWSSVGPGPDRRGVQGLSFLCMPLLHCLGLHLMLLFHACESSLVGWMLVVACVVTFLLLRQVLTFPLLPRLQRNLFRIWRALRSVSPRGWRRYVTRVIHRRGRGDRATRRRRRLQCSARSGRSDNVRGEIPRLCRSRNLRTSLVLGCQQL